jgi:tRNA (mo5U34)-methyltransferase
MLANNENPIYEMLNHIGAERRQQFLANRWWHSIDLGNGVITPGAIPLSEMQANFAYLQLPEDLSGKRVLDIGCWDGFYSFECERRGAEVVAVDCWRPEGFFLAHEALQSRVQFHELSVYELSRARLGSFDIVLFLGVLYHLRHPLLALERGCEMTDDFALIETHVIDNARDVHFPALEFYEWDELGGQYDNWCGPNTEGLLVLTRSAGFVRPEILQQHATRSLVKAYRHWAKPSIEPAPTLRLRQVSNAIHFQPFVPQHGRHSYVAIWVEGLPADVTRERLQIEIGGYGIAPYYAGAAQDDSIQINAPVPPGLPIGAATVKVFFENYISDEATINVVAGTTW